MSLQLTFDLIIEFFEANFNIRFVYFESDLMYKWFPDKKQTIKYRLTSKSTLSLVDSSFCNVCSGMTIPDFETQRFIVYINQDVVKSRVNVYYSSRTCSYLLPSYEFCIR